MSAPHDPFDSNDPSGSQEAADTRATELVDAGVVDVAASSDVPEGGLRGVDVGRARVIISRIAGRLHAISGLCTHQIAYLEDGQHEGCVIRCPRHGAGFDLRTGEALDLPAEYPAATFDVVERGGRIYVARRPRGSGAI